LERQVFTIVVNDIFVRDVIKIRLVRAVVAIKRGDDDVLVLDSLFFQPFSKELAGVGNVAALSNDFVGQIVRVLDDFERLEPVGVFVA